jgi:hypothetical protein
MPLDASSVGQQQAGPLGWLVRQGQQPHPVTQLMPNFADLARMMMGSGANLLNTTNQALYGGKRFGSEDAGKITQNLMDVSLMNAPTALAANQASLPFFSALIRGVEQAPLKQAPGDQWLGTLKNTPGIKQEEMDWTGLQRYMAGKPNVTKQEALDFLDANKVDVQEVVKGEMKFAPSKYNLPEVRRAIQQAGDNPGELELTLANDGDAYRALTRRFPELSENEDWASIVANDVYRGDTRPPDTTKFSQYQLPGGENYRELLLTLPESGPFDLTDSLGKVVGRAPTRERAREMGYGDRSIKPRGGEGFRSGHYDEPNVLAHVRFNDRVDAQGKKTLFIEEIQSDWHQKGRKQGYQGAKPVQRYMVVGQGDETIGRFDTEAEAIAAAEEVFQRTGRQADAMRLPPGGTTGVPDAPFKTSWPDLSLKRMIKWAADNGHDNVAWTPGKVQAERYDLSKQIDSLRVTRRNEGGYDLDVVKRGGHRDFHEGLATAVPEDKLADHVGKELAEKIAKQESQENTYTGLDLKVGGEGMTAFYDKMLVNSANKLGKKFGAKVQTGLLGGGFELKELGSGRWAIKAGGHFLKDAGGAGRSWATRDEALAELKHQINIGNAGEGAVGEVWSLPITDAMRSEVQSKGMPLFVNGAPLGVSAAAIGQQQRMRPEQAKQYLRGNLL